MKSTKTWVLLANARQARIVENLGVGKGYHGLPNKTWQAEPATDYSDSPGTGHSSSGDGSRSRMEETDPSRTAEIGFANEIADRLTDFRQDGAFDRIVLTAGPHMLGALRTAIGGRLDGVIHAEIDKDLTQVPVEDLSKHLDRVLAA